MVRIFSKAVEETRVWPIQLSFYIPIISVEDFRVHSGKEIKQVGFLEYSLTEIMEVVIF